MRPYAGTCIRCGNAFDESTYPTICVPCLNAAVADGTTLFGTLRGGIHGFWGGTKRKAWCSADCPPDDEGIRWVACGPEGSPGVTCPACREQVERWAQWKAANA